MHISRLYQAAVCTKRCVKFSVLPDTSAALHMWAKQKLYSSLVQPGNMHLSCVALPPLYNNMHCHSSVTLGSTKFKRTHLDVMMNKMVFFVSFQILCIYVCMYNSHMYVDPGCIGSSTDNLLGRITDVRGFVWKGKLLMCVWCTSHRLDLWGVHFVVI